MSCMNAESDRLELQSLTDRQEKFTIISSENTPSHSERRKKKRVEWREESDGERKREKRKRKNRKGMGWERIEKMARR